MSSTKKATDDMIGEVVAGKYRLDRLLGTGSVGAVYAAVHQFTGKHVALKLIDPSFADYEGYGTRFLREARAAAEIGHPVICDVLDAGKAPDGSLYLALELLEGRTLEDAIESDDLRLDEIVDVGIQVLDGMAAAHDRGIVHRDIKPENIFLTWNEKGELRVKIIDFGIAKRTKASPEVFITSQGAVLGTPYYMAPEQAAGDPVDGRADIWSVGAVLFHALTGAPPFDEESYNRLIARLLNEDPPKLGEVNEGLPEWLVTAVEGALQRAVSDRWQSARTMKDVLESKGTAPIELDWEVHEDATVRTDSIFGEPDSRPATLRLLGGEPEEASIEIDIGSAEIPIEPPALDEPAFDVGGGETIKSQVPPEFYLDSVGPPGGTRKRVIVWIGVGLGVLFASIVMIIVGMLLSAHGIVG